MPPRPFGNDDDDDEEDFQPNGRANGSDEVAEDDNEDGPAEQEDEEQGDDADKDSSEEDEDEDNEYDLTDKFIAQEDEEEEDGNASEGEKERRTRHKRRRDRSPELDEEDYELLEENQVTGIRRKQKAGRKRIRKQNDGDHKTDAQRLQEELFGADDGIEDEVAEEPQQRRAAEEDEFNISGDEMADFIDDDDGRGGGNQQRRARRQNSGQGVSSRGVQELQDIFGDVDDLLEIYAEKKAANVLREEGEDEDIPPPADDDADPDALDAYQERLREKRLLRKQKQMEGAIEPELMERLMMLPLDDRIRETDAPERFQLSGDSELKEAFSESQYDDAALFILDNLVGPVAEAEEEGASAGRVKRSAASTILEDGVMEVDGNPRDGRPRREKDMYERYELEQSVQDLSKGRRAIRRKRHDDDIVHWKKDPTSRERLFLALKNVLKEQWKQKHEIPLIACFRKELCGELLAMRAEDRPGMTEERDVRRRREKQMPSFLLGTVQAKHRRLRRWEVLWAVYDLSSKWRALVKRKEKRLEAYRIAAARLDTLASENPDFEADISSVKASVQSCVEAATEAQTMDVLDDVDLKFKMVTAGHNLDAFEDNAMPGTRRPSRSSAYSALKKAGLDEVVKAMAMSATDFGENLKRNLKRNEPEDSRNLPEDLAFKCVRPDDTTLNEPEKVLERARQILVLEILHEPNVRDFVRRNIAAHMHISTEPTAAGATQLDAFNPLGRVKRLRRMPVSAFAGTDDYLRLHVAEKEGLITATSEVEDLEEVFVKPMLEYYNSSAVSAVSKEWNNLRSMIIRDAVQRLVPQLQQEMYLWLLSQARSVVAESYSQEFWRYASTPPVQMKSEEGDVVERRRLTACCWGEERSATCLVMLDEHGSLVDVLYLPSFSGPQRVIRPGMDYNIAEDPKKAEDVRKVVEFCRDNRPQAIFVGARNLFCKALKEDMSRIGDFILDAHAQILTSGHDTGTIEVCYAEETLADLWAKSAAALEEFPDHPETVRRAVALGRLALEPLAIVAALAASNGKEVLSLNLHPMQSHVPEADLLKEVERSIMTVVAQVGADINLMAANNWLCPILPFVSGLGPRKAQSLLQAMRAHEFALNRISIWREIWEPGNCVFRNCGAFLKITTKARALVNAEVEVIDSARVHPLSYKLACDVAAAAIEGGGGVRHSEDAVNFNKALEEPAAVEDLNLEELNTRLADSSARPSDHNQISTLIDISMELLLPDMELRFGNITEMAQMKETQFWWMVGETPATLKQGRRVEAVVRYVGNNEARCMIPEMGGLNATISAADISSQGQVTPSDFLKVGQTVAARIKSVKAEEFSVDLTTTSTDLNDDVNWEEQYSKAGNPFYHVQSNEERRAIEVQKRRQARSNQLAKRTIDHPNFKNVSMSEAVNYLQDMPVGEALFRPSTKSLDIICLTIKIYSSDEGDIIMHRDVREGAKRGGKLGLGLPLRLMTSSKKEQKFEDLDEVLATYVEPMCERFKEAYTHRKFKAGSWDEVKEELQRDAQQAHPQAATYCLAFDELHPGFMLIGSILPTINRTPHREYFSVCHEGFWFRQKMYQNIEKVLNIFKRNPKGGMHAPPEMIPQMNPLMSMQYGYAPQQQMYPPGFGPAGQMPYVAQQQYQAYQ